MATFNKSHYDAIIAGICDNLMEHYISDEHMSVESFVATLARIFQADNPRFSKPLFWNSFRDRMKAAQEETKRQLPAEELPWWLQEKEI